MVRSLHESLNVGFPASSTTNEALWNDSRHRSPPVIAQTGCLSLMTQNRASSPLRWYRQVRWWGSLMCFPLGLGQLQSTHAFRRPWSLFRLLLSRLEERENSSSHHTYQHQTRCCCRHHPPHHRHYLTAISTLASSSCEAMKLSWLTFTMSDAVTTVTMRFSSRPTRFPTSSSSRSFASCCTTEKDCCCCCCCC